MATKAAQAAADQQHVARPLHHGTRRQNRVARPEDARHRARPAIRSIHDASIHLLRPGAGEDAAPAGIEQRVVLERRDRYGYRVEGAGTRGENLAARRQGAAQAVMV